MIIVNHFQNGVKIPDLLVNVVISLLEQFAWTNSMNGYFNETFRVFIIKKGWLES